MVIAYPVQAVEWSCHAATTIKDASGAVIAECSGNGRHTDDDVAAAAEIVRRLNANDALVQELRTTTSMLRAACFVVRDPESRRMVLEQVRDAERAIMLQGGAA